MPTTPFRPDKAKPQKAVVSIMRHQQMGFIGKHLHWGFTNRRGSKDNNIAYDSKLEFLTLSGGLQSARYY